nr:immunoglobulin heavy chain junction region [Macaca mulatta]MPN69286.1 immunoglobulin heavy chain junction region [Macaca mulatta]MPN69480.1 immunoglobulin heavy chain junction region [Macaca mulatta]MPN69731.1 immunoglobulin heavy chain junction region [Macaca mulatta]MPN70092.1 immunoglobulin heavy chain junction region [Macaca mulatta]
CYNEGDCW